jgi:hypothetical protein
MKSLVGKINESLVFPDITLKQLYNAILLYKQQTKSSSLEFSNIFGIYIKNQVRYLDDHSCIIVSLDVNENSKEIICMLEDTTNSNRFPFNVKIPVSNKKIKFIDSLVVSQLLSYIFMELIK